MKRLPQSFSAQAIAAVWRQSRDATPSTAGSPGIDRVRAAAFASELKDNIDRIRLDIRSSNYRFQNLRSAPVLKKTGGYRIIAVPTVRDRLVQRALLSHLESTPRFDASSPISFGFTKGKTLQDALRHALAMRKERPWVLLVDIEKFFDRIPRKKIQSLIRKTVRSTIVCDLLCSAAECELDSGSGSVSEIIRTNGIKKGLGLRQGMPVSPMLSNLLLKDFDRKVLKRSIPAIRYADDIAIFANSGKECLSAFEFIRGELEKYDLHVSDIDSGKTILAQPSQAVEFLGVEIRRFGADYRLCAPMKKLEKIKADMEQMSTVASCINERRNIGHLVRALDSFVIGHAASMRVLDHPEEFSNRLENIKRDVLEEFLNNLIGADAVRLLDGNGRAILGLTPFGVPS